MDGGSCGWTKSGSGQPGPLQPTDWTQAQGLLSDAEIQESSKLGQQVATRSTKAPLLFAGTQRYP
ncbi:unnamed protein product [Gulo gulo]|uniref:Uncharacterized protein n=1 Tax=Gulo gulo TaxID=48420 RepID=A0A9X9LSU8_GULGU|nr:unnamed protein product [Gulo gulo]